MAEGEMSLETIRQWEGIRPHTWSYDLAETRVFFKQSPGPGQCDLLCEGSPNYDDGEDALSLSDLPLTSNSSDWEEYFTYTKGGESPCLDQNFFEFSNDDFSASSENLNVKDNIVFCGKLIPYREAQVPIGVHEMETNSGSKPKEAHTRANRLFTWNSSFDKSRTSSLTSKVVKNNNEDGKTLARTSKGGRVGANLTMRKMPVLSSPLKSRWYLFAFGVGRFPMAMDKSDMKKRQNKKRGSNYSTNDRREMSNISNGSSRSSSNGSSARTSSLWSVLSNIGCRNQQADISFKVSPDVYHLSEKF